MHLGERFTWPDCVYDPRTHAGCDHDGATLVLVVDPEFGRCACRIEHTKDVHREDLLEVIFRELQGGLDDGNTSVLHSIRTMR